MQRWRRLAVLLALAAVVGACDLSVAPTPPVAIRSSAAASTATAGTVAEQPPSSPVATSSTGPVAASSPTASPPVPPSVPPVVSASVPPSGSAGSASVSPSVSPSTTVVPVESPSASATAPPDLSKYGWLHFGSATEGQGIEGPVNPTGDTLIDISTGLLDGTLTARIHLRREAPSPPVDRGATPFVEGPFGRYVVYGFFDPAGSQLHRLDLLTGIDETVLRDPRVVHRAVFDPHANTYYLALLDPSTRADLGIWRFRPGIDAAPTRLEPPTGLRDAGPGPYRRLFLTPSGRSLVVVDCALLPGSTFDCEAGILDASSGRKMRSLGPVPMQIVTATDRWLVAAGEAVALDGSGIRTLPPACGAGTVTEAAGDDVVVFESSGPGCNRSYYEVTALDLESGTSHVIYSDRDFHVDTDPALVPYEEHTSLPPGTVLLAPANQAADPDRGPGTLLSVADGALSELPPWPTDPTVGAREQPAPPDGIPPALRAFLETTTWSGSTGDRSIVGNLFGSWRTVDVPIDQGGVLAIGRRLVSQGRDKGADWIGDVDGSTGAVRRWTLPNGLRAAAVLPGAAGQVLFAATNARGDDAGIWRLAEKSGRFSQVAGPQAPPFHFGLPLTSPSGRVVGGVACTTGTDPDPSDVCRTVIASSRGCRPGDVAGVVATVADACILVGGSPNPIARGPWIVRDEANGTQRSVSVGGIVWRDGAVVVEASRVVVAGYDSARTTYAIVLVDVATGRDRIVLAQPTDAKGGVARLDIRAITTRYALLDRAGRIDVLELGTGRVLRNVSRAGPGA